jgi:hypothetical protein
MATKTKFGDLDLAAINNRLAKRHPDQVETVEKFKSEDDAKAIVNTALQQTGERLIRILKPDYIKRGNAAKCWGRYKDGMLVSEFIDISIAQGDTRGGALRDLRYNDKHGLIKIYG